MTQKKDIANIKLDSVVNECEYNADGLALYEDQTYPQSAMVYYCGGQW